MLITAQITLCTDNHEYVRCVDVSLHLVDPLRQQLERGPVRQIKAHKRAVAASKVRSGQCPVSFLDDQKLDNEPIARSKQRHAPALQYPTPAPQHALQCVYSSL